MICVQLMCGSVEKVVNEMGVAKDMGADVVEIRLDCLEGFQPRPKSEGVQYEGDEKSRLDALRLAGKLGADYIDIEFKVASDFLVDATLEQLANTKIIVSCHVDAENSSIEDLNHLVYGMQSTGADIIKIVTDATDITHLDKIFNLLSHRKLPMVAYSTGVRGLISQLLSPKFGGFMVYASMGNGSVPGLPTLDSIKQAYKPELVNAETKVFGLISKPVGHSKGPLLHSPTFRLVGYNGIYVPMHVDDLKEFFRVYSYPDFAGFSVGFPYKEAVTAHCDEIHPLAKVMSVFTFGNFDSKKGVSVSLFLDSIGAVNTIIRRPTDGKLIGYNTDCEAAISAIEDALREKRCIGDPSILSPLNGKQFVLAGAGGAGRALAFGAKSRGARVIVFDIDYERAKSLALSVSGEAHRFEDIINFCPADRAILANATPLGMHPNTDRIPDTLGVYELVFDSVYTPRKTRLLIEAEAAGATIVSGVEMFLRQAAGQFNLFTGGEDVDASEDR
ncbi:hypothetical protein Sjap_006730 [Stephania japonica]|uniref:Shikimate dehydrogenase substrate binding N-terminal domain-containing protein n=1 Tax=Stephania japonica TaxID=461633 RepID=A0AAP0PK10_9MAGN